MGRASVDRMPGNDTHRLVGTAGAAIVCAALVVPIVWWPVSITAAAVASPWPDHLERIPRALWRRTRRHWADGSLDRRLRRLQVHRGWTHWLSIGLALSIIVGLAAGAAVIGACELLLVGAHGVAPDRSVTMPDQVWAYAPWVGIFAALGVLVGHGLHSYFDTWTELGSPMGGPWCKRRLHTVPKRWAARRERRGRKPWITKDDEVRLQRWAPRIVSACVALHFRHELWSAGVWLYDVARPALT